MTYPISTDGAETLLVDMRSFTSEQRLLDAIFKSQQFERYVNGSNILSIYLDSFDECLAHIPTVSAMIVDEFGKYRERE